MVVPGDRFQIWPALGSMVLTFFFYGMLEMIKEVTHCYDGKVDGFDPNSMLVETEQACFIAFCEPRDLESVKELERKAEVGENGDLVDNSDGAWAELERMRAEGIPVDESPKKLKFERRKRRMKMRGITLEEEEEEEEEEDEDDDDD